jgi:hypothetical protein
MTTLANIEAFLDIDIGERKLRDGRRQKDKNQYYYYENQYYIVKLTKDMWTILEDCRKTRQLLRVNCWHHSDGYAVAKVGYVHRRWHQQFLNYDEDLVADHINNKRYDNRNDNLRVVTTQMNSRNKSTRTDNTSGKQGVERITKQGLDFWKARITGNNKKRIERLFSVNKYGENEAKCLAIEKRKELEIELGYIGD